MSLRCDKLVVKSDSKRYIGRRDGTKYPLNEPVPL